jgi:hypothetical protein
MAVPLTAPETVTTRVDFRRSSPIITVTGVDRMIQRHHMPEAMAGEVKKNCSVGSTFFAPVGHAHACRFVCAPSSSVYCHFSWHKERVFASAGIRHVVQPMSCQEEQC